MKIRMWIMGFLSILGALFAPKEVYSSTESFVIMDVRTPEEFSASHVKGAINIDFYGNQFKAEIEKLDKSKNYKLYCRSGNRSGQTEKLMKGLGFKEVENLGSLSSAARRLNKPCEGGSKATCD